MNSNINLEIPSCNATTSSLLSVVIEGYNYYMYCILYMHRDTHRQ
jgi:hypothetical protein